MFAPCVIAIKWIICFYGRGNYITKSNYVLVRIMQNDIANFGLPHTFPVHRFRSRAGG